MLMETMDALLEMVASLPPFAGLVAIVLSTFVLEDVAIVGTGLLASSGMVEPVSGGLALLVGIILGDFGLFALGRGAARLPGLRHYVDTHAAQRLKGASAQRSFSLVFTTRFVPGMRLPTYTGLGYVGASFWQFFYAVIFAVTLWTVLLYSLVVFLGQNVLEMLGAWKWVGIAVLITGVIVAEKLLVRRNRSALTSASGPLGNNVE